ncbi:MAG: hypothetical protein V4704_10215 [Pseudomonadota bacterium]
MNERRPDHIQPGDAELRMALRGLRQDLAPGHDLWPGIAARIQSMPRQAPPPLMHGTHRLWPFAMAASVLLAVGVAWQVKPLAEPAAISGQSVAAATLVQREAASMTVQYRAALRELETASVSASWQPGLESLDRGAAEIRGALQQNPDSRLLLERLRETYARRLALARRALYA